jgi:hypothetical protein
MLSAVRFVVLAMSEFDVLIVWFSVSSRMGRYDHKPADAFRPQGAPSSPASPHLQQKSRAGDFGQWSADVGDGTTPAVVWGSICALTSGHWLGDWRV